MQELIDTTLMDRYLSQHQISSLFDTKNVPFHLFRYEKGEILNRAQTLSECLLFVVQGSLQLYTSRQSGSLNPIQQVDSFIALGDVELCGQMTPPFLAEAKTTVFCLMLPLCQHREILLQDNRFLRFLLRSVADKLQIFCEAESALPTVEEKILHYLQAECPSSRLTNVGKAALQLRCSRRQLQRVLKKLVEQHRIFKSNKGCYQLME